MLERLLSDEILSENRDVWDQMLRHRFVLDIEADRLDPDVFHRYLVYENAFVETAISIFGHLLVKSPGVVEQRRLISVLKALSEDQLGYFRDSFAELGVSDVGSTTLDLPMPVLAFQQGMLSYAAHGPYVEGVAVMFAAEWMYWHWCTRVIAQPISNPTVHRWVALHTDDTFASQAQWLKQQVDSAGRNLDETGRRRASKAFRSALQLEIEFHTAPYLAWEFPKAV